MVVVGCRSACVLLYLIPYGAHMFGEQSIRGASSSFTMSKINNKQNALQNSCDTHRDERIISCRSDTSRDRLVYVYIRIYVCEDAVGEIN